MNRDISKLELLQVAREVMEEKLVIVYVCIATMFTKTFGKQLSGKNYHVNEKLGTLRTDMLQL